MMDIPVRPSPGMSADELRGWASRKNLAEDARWAMDFILSSKNAPEFEGLTGLIFSHHVVRIAHEGAIAIRSDNPHVGVPMLAALLKSQFAQITERARHLTKMLDNKKKPYAEALSDLATELKAHRDTFMGNAIPLVRWLETDLGTFFVDGAFVGATVPAAYRLGVNLGRPGSMWEAGAQPVSEEWGGTLAILGAATFDASEQQPGLDLTRFQVALRDRRSDRYLSGRFDPHFPQELKVLLLMIEGDLNTARLILPCSAALHRDAAFRARVVTCYHCLSALKRISDQHPSLDTKGLRGLRTILGSRPALRILSKEGEKVRNRSVHYEMNDPTIIPDLEAPMSGVVEAVFPGHTWEAFDKDVREVTERSAEYLALWKP